MIINSYKYVSAGDVNRVTLLHCNGADTSTTFTDTGSNPQTFTANGNAQVDTAASKFGGGSALFDGSGDDLTAADNSNWDIMDSTSNDMTLDFWVKFAASTGDDTMIAQYEDGSNRWTLRRQGGAETPQFFMVSGGSTVFNITGASNDLNNTDWNHLAFIRVGGLYGLYVNGTQTGYSADTSVDTFAGTLFIGDGGASAQSLDGWMDEISFYQGNPFGASPNSTPDDTITVPIAEYANF